MKSLEDQLNELIVQSDRVSAELNRELYLIGRADAAISYLRLVREQTSQQVAALLEQRAMNAISPISQASAVKRSNGFGRYDPNWPQ
ncbi:MAG TPA: hypothetical protein VNK52_11125 [Hyphomicrobiaceae bacterium]|nr:hypothetical protein [Hyphomicrobiaceae bacterium]